MKKADTLRFVQALVASSMIYGTPYALLTKTENKFDTLLRNVYKQALALPPYTFHDCLLKLGLATLWTS